MSTNTEPVTEIQCLHVHNFVTLLCCFHSLFIYVNGIKLQQQAKQIILGHHAHLSLPFFFHKNSTFLSGL
jgi:hypothetical protein